jgi:hypothetical protein
LPGDHFRSPQVPQIRARHRIELRLAKERVSNAISRDVVRPTLVAQQEGGPVYGIGQSFHGLVIAFSNFVLPFFKTNELSPFRHFSAGFYRQPILPVELVFGSGFLWSIRPLFLVVAGVAPGWLWPVPKALPHFFTHFFALFRRQ